MIESPLCRVLAAQDPGELAKARPERSGVPFSLARQLKWADSSKSKQLSYWWNLLVREFEQTARICDGIHERYVV